MRGDTRDEMRYPVRLEIIFKYLQFLADDWLGGGKCFSK